VRGQLQTPETLPPGEINAGTQWAEGWVTPKNQWGSCGEEGVLLLLSEIEPKFIGRPTRSLVTIQAYFAIRN
jgi:hypothetical protein